jgi:hypothetical protein
MTAYASNASGDWNDSTKWTPNGIPGSADTVTMGVHTITIPLGYTAQCGGLVMTGTGTGTRSILTIAGKLELYANCSSTNFANIAGVGNCEIDLRGFSFEFGTGTAGATTKLSNDGTGIFKIWSSTTLGYIGRPAAQQKSGDLDLNGFLIVNTAFRYGGNFNAGFHYRLRNGIFYNCGYIDIYDYIERTADWIIENVDFRMSQVASASNVYLWARNNSGTITGQRLFKNVTFDYRASAKNKVTLRYFNSAMDFDNVVCLKTELEILDSGTLNLKNLLSAKQGIIGSFSGASQKCYFAPDTNNPHTLENFINGSMTECVIEALYPIGATDAGDHFILPVGSATFTLTRSLVIDGRGGVMFNALKANTSGTYTMDHCTYVCDAYTGTYGQLARNESGQIFQAAATTTIRSTIAHVRSNPNSLTNMNVIRMDTAGNDQIDYIDFNLYNGQGTNNTQKFYQMTSATKTYGVTDGWGLHDIQNGDPMFVDQSRGIVSWGALFGYADYDDTCLGILNSVNGFDEGTLTQDGAVSGRSVTDLIAWVTAGFVPQNAAIATAAHDGTTIGAFEYQAPAPTGGGLSVAGLSNSGLSNSGLSVTGL